MHWLAPVWKQGPLLTICGRLCAQESGLLKAFESCPESSERSSMFCPNCGQQQASQHWHGEKYSKSSDAEEGPPRSKTIGLEDIARLSGTHRSRRRCCS